VGLLKASARDSRVVGHRQIASNNITTVIVIIIKIVQKSLKNTHYNKNTERCVYAANQKTVKIKYKKN